MAVAKRSTMKVLKSPLLLIAPLAWPLFQFAAFAGALGAFGDTPNFGYYNYTAFVFTFVFFQAMVFTGVFTGIEEAGDYQSGFADRMMLAVPRRLAILGGYTLFAFGRAVVAGGVVWGVALATGMPVRGHPLEIVGMLALGAMLAIAATWFASGVALRLRSTAAGPLIFLPCFLLLFLAPSFAPRHLISGWVHYAADVNPLTPPVEAARNFLAHTPAHVGLAFGVTAALLLCFSFFAVTGMRAAEQGPGGRPVRRGRPGGRGGRGRRRRARRASDRAAAQA